MDQTRFVVSPKAYAEFLARLDARSRPHSGLRRTLETAEPGEK
jgi:uncharacterized protein (DUF1778 family)